MTTGVSAPSAANAAAAANAVDAAAGDGSLASDMTSGGKFSSNHIPSFNCSTYKEARLTEVSYTRGVYGLVYTVRHWL